MGALRAAILKAEAEPGEDEAGRREVSGREGSDQDARSTCRATTSGDDRLSAASREGVCEK